MRPSCWALAAASLAVCSTALFGSELTACSSDPPSGDSVSTVADAGPDAAPVTYMTEKALALDLVLTLADAGPSEAGPEVLLDATGPEAVSDAAAPDEAEGPEAGASDAPDAAAPDAARPDAGGVALDAGPPPPAATLTITAHDGAVPLITDLWLYTLDGAQNPTPLTAFTSTATRKSPHLMLPATIGGRPSGLVPADIGVANGLMTGTTRGKLADGAFVSTVTGRVVVSFAAIPTAPILVVAAVEDQRYAGAAAINPDGSAAQVPAGIGEPETHALRSFARDVAPILKAQCELCHQPKGPENADFYKVTGTRDELVNDNFVIAEQTLKCQTADAGQPVADCVRAITEAQFLVEPGAPAASGLLQRSRPDEDAGTSASGLAWYGSRGNRYNTTYGDRRMPSTVYTTDPKDWTNAPAFFDLHPDQFQVIYDWVAQGAPE